MTYLDHAATTPVLPEAIAAMAAELQQVGNASSLHGPGRRARRVVEESRESIAAGLGVQPREIVFTAGGTEANNLITKGVFWAQSTADPKRRRIVTTAIEHHALLDPVQWLTQAEGALVDEVPVDRSGRVDLEAFEATIARDPEDIALVSVMWANNEVGTVQPVAEIAAIAREYRIPVHTDAVQAIGHLDVDIAASGLDAVSFSAHKFGGPPGVGALVLSRTLDPVPLIHGGGQERDVRSGTLDVPSIAGMAAGLLAALAMREERNARVEKLRARLVEGVRRVVPDAVLNGPEELDSAHRLPGNAHFSFAGCEGDALLLLLDAQGIACSTGSACSAGLAQPSHVLLAMGADEVTARSSLRFSLGHDSCDDDVDAVIAAIGPAVERARAAGSAARRV
jgi:cysteine desulfurase